MKHFELNNHCRLCLEKLTDNKNNIFSKISVNYDDKTFNKQLNEFIMEVSSIQIENDCNLKFICQTCFDSLYNVYKFIVKCQCKNEQFKKIILKEEIIEPSIDIKSSETSFQCTDTITVKNEWFELEISGLNGYKNEDIKNETSSNEEKTRVSTTPEIQLGNDNQTNIDSEFFSSDDEIPLSNFKTKLVKCEHSDCQILFKNKRIMKSHLIRQHLENTDKVLCKICQKVFESKQSLDDHMRLHEDNKYYKCLVCCKQIKLMYYLKLHYEQHIQYLKSILNYRSVLPDQLLNDHVCIICLNSFKQIDELVRHQNQKHLENIKCCKQQFDIDRFKDHLKKTHKLNFFICLICFKTFNLIYGLKYHLKYTHEEYSQSITNESDDCECVLCLSPITNRLDCLNHLFKHMNETFDCVNCLKKFATKKQLEKHQARKHAEIGCCQYCGRNNFTKRLQLKNHVRKHIQGKTFKECPHCKKMYSLTTIYLHIRRHTNDRRFVCSICGKRFFESCSLQLHTRTHTNERPFKCSFPGCDATFKTSSHKNDHVKRHLGVKRYECDICMKTLSSSTTLKFHKRIHTGERPFKCSSCDMKFICFTKCKKHEKVKHKLFESK